MKNIAFLISLLYFSALSYCGSSDSLNIYLLTYSPGKELYSTFGHSSIRVEDKMTGSDIVYNYGHFDFETKNFYFKFFKGKLDYYLSKSNTEWVLRATDMEKRSITQNELLLTHDEKIKLLHALEINYLPKNRAYRYDFLYDNCASRVFYLVDSITDGKYNSNMEYSSPRFNSLINNYLSLHPFAQLGFNLIAGKQILQKTTAIEGTFLPDYLKLYMKSLSCNNRYLLGPDQSLLINPPQGQQKNFFNWITITVLVLAISIRFIEEWIQRTFNLWSIIVLSILTVYVFVSLLLWSFSEHQIYALNFNLLWAIPLLLLVFLNKSHNRLKILLFIPILLGMILVIVFMGFYLPMLIIIVLVLSRIKFYKKRL